MMFNRSRNHIILLQDPDKMSSGHWLGLSIHPERREIFYFSSYGGKPDVEKHRWIPADSMIESHQSTDVFNDGLKELMEEDGWTIHYNQYRYQIEGDRTATCGIWTAAFLRTGMNPDDFNWFVEDLGLTPVHLYYAYFLDTPPLIV